MELILSILQFVWLIISNTYVLAFIITRIIMIVARELFGFWFGTIGGIILYAIVASLLFLVL